MLGAVISISIVSVVIAGITIGVASYFRLQRHRADAVAMASYRKLAEEAVEKQAELHAELRTVQTRLAEIETMLRSVG